MGEVNGKQTDSVYSEHEGEDAHEERVVDRRG